MAVCVTRLVRTGQSWSHLLHGEPKGDVYQVPVGIGSLSLRKRSILCRQKTSPFGKVSVAGLTFLW